MIGGLIDEVAAEIESIWKAADGENRDLTSDEEKRQYLLFQTI